MTSDMMAGDASPGAISQMEPELQAASIATLAGLDLPVAGLTFLGAPNFLSSSALIACVPARNEADRIENCLGSLDRDLAPGDGVVLVANNCDDGTAALASALLAASARPWLIAECRWLAGRGSAPLARRLALDIANRLAPEATLLSVDGDTIVRPGLRASYAQEFARGFDLVCGRIDFLPDEAALLPPADPQSEGVIREYRDASRHIAALLSPDPDNPWPHHGNIGGANFAMRGGAYRIAGPLPTPPSGEDRALRRRFEAFGLRIRYSDLPHVETSCRLVGRASGGLSDELRRNRRELDPVVDELLEPPETLLFRCRSKAAFRSVADAQARGTVLRSLGLRPIDAERLAFTGNEAEWQQAEDLSPALRRARLRLSDLRRLLPELRRTLASLRN